jgi:hypothetical protein
LTILSTLALALAPTPPQMSAPSDAAAARCPLRRLSVALSADRTRTQRGDTITYTLRATNTGRQTIGAFTLAMKPTPNFLPGDASCDPVPGQPGFPTPDGLWCEYGWELAPGASVTMTLRVQIPQVDGDNPPVWTIMGCATIQPRVGGTPPSPTCAASALAVSGVGVRHSSRAPSSH